MRIFRNLSEKNNYINVRPKAAKKNFVAHKDGKNICAASGRTFIIIFLINYEKYVLGWHLWELEGAAATSILASAAKPCTTSAEVDPALAGRGAHVLMLATPAQRRGTELRHPHSRLILPQSPPFSLSLLREDENR